MSPSRIALITDERHNEADDAAARLRAVSLHHPHDLEPLEYVVSSGISTDGPRALWGLRARLIKDEITAIHVMSAGVAAMTARWLSAGLQLPLIASYGGAAESPTTAYGGFSVIARRRYERWFFKACTRVVVSSELVYDDVIRERWAGSEQLVVARAGVHAGLFSPNKRSSEMRDAWRVSDRRPAILCTGVASPRELDLLARFRRILEDYRRPHRFVVCAPRGHREAWQGAIPDAAFMDDLEDPQLAPIFASSDLFLSARETPCPDPGTTLLMAQASGLPVIVSNLGAHRENMIHAATGYVCRAGSEQDFACRASELLANGPRRAVMAVTAVAYAGTRPWATALEPLFQAYREAACLAATPAPELSAIGVRTA